MKDENPTKLETVEDMAFDELVNIIDNRLEYIGSYYMEQIKREYNIS